MVKNQPFLLGAEGGLLEELLYPPLCGKEKSLNKHSCGPPLGNLNTSTTFLWGGSVCHLGSDFQNEKVLGTSKRI